MLQPEIQSRRLRQLLHRATHHGWNVRLVEASEKNTLGETRRDGSGYRLCRTTRRER